MNTAMLYVSDHGESLGEKGLSTKRLTGCRPTSRCRYRW